MTTEEMHEKASGIWDNICLMDLGIPEPEEKALIGMLLGYSVFVVNDNWVKQTYCADFTEGSNHEACNDAYDTDVIKKEDWIPRDEIWLSSAIESKIRPFILLHEYCEAELMKAGMEYEDAHEEVLKLEMQKRREVLGERRLRSFSEFLKESFPNMTKSLEKEYLRKNKNGRKKGGIMPRPPVRKTKGVAAHTGKRADSFFY